MIASESPDRRPALPACCFYAVPPGKLFVTERMIREGKPHEIGD